VSHLNVVSVEFDLSVSRPLIKLDACNCTSYRFGELHMLLKGRAMVQAVSRRPLTAEARVRSRVCPCGIYGGQSGTGTGFSPSTSVSPCQFHSTGAPLPGKGQSMLLNVHIFWDVMSCRIVNRYRRIGMA
jgi:hypothetical protein